MIVEGCKRIEEREKGKGVCVSKSVCGRVECGYTFYFNLYGGLSVP